MSTTHRNALDLLVLALRRRCPNCGEGKVYRGFSQLSTCSVCGYRYSREHGYFLGAMIVAYAVIGGLALATPLVLMSLGVSPLVAVVTTMVAAMVALVLFVPFSHTLWMAIDLRFDPPKPEDFER